MATPHKTPILAKIIITIRGVARVEFANGMAGSIRRVGVQNYAAYSDLGDVAGRGGRYEAAARALARHYGLRDRHMIDVEIEHAYREVPSLDG